MKISIGTSNTDNASNLDLLPAINWPMLKNPLAAMLGGWVTYFLVLQLFITKLNKTNVPILCLPLGALLVIQGSLVVFLLSVFLFKRQASNRRNMPNVNARHADKPTQS